VPLHLKIQSFLTSHQPSDPAISHPVVKSSVGIGWEKSCVNDQTAMVVRSRTMVVVNIRIELSFSPI
jgi:hypothetical protein